MKRVCVFRKFILLDCVGVDCYVITKMGRDEFVAKYYHDGPDYDARGFRTTKIEYEPLMTYGKAVKNGRFAFIKVPEGSNTLFVADTLGDVSQEINIDEYKKAGKRIVFSISGKKGLKIK